MYLVVARKKFFSGLKREGGREGGGERVGERGAREGEGKNHKTRGTNWDCTGTIVPFRSGTMEHFGSRSAPLLEFERVLVGVEGGV
jgi:hypothetical protein